MAEFEPLYTTEEMKAAETGHDVEGMMTLADGAVAAAVARDYPGARVVAICGKNANGGDGAGVPPVDYSARPAMPASSSIRL